jgi:WD40 repeat protein
MQLQRASFSVADSEFSPDGRLLASAFGNGGCAVWEFKNSQAPPLRCMQQFNDRAFNVMWLNEGSQLLCTGFSKSAGCVSVIDLLSPSRSRPSDNFINSTSGICSACFVRGGALIALGFRDGGISLCDLRMRASVTHRDAVHSSSVRTLVSPFHGSWFASSGSDGHVQVLDSMFLNALQTFESQHPRATYFHSGSTSLAHFGVTGMILEAGALWTCGADGRIVRRKLS